jgi:hypothetical protein
MSVEALISTQVIDTTTVGRALMTAVDASGARTTLGLGSLATQSGTFSGTSSGTNTGDQTITLTGDVTGTGTGSFVATIGAAKVTNAMLAGSIAASNLVGTDIATLGTVTAGTLSTGAVIAGVTITVGSDATGDLYYRNASGIFTRLGIGSAAQVLTVTGGLPSWAAGSGLSGTGAVDNAVLRADGTGGATLQSSAFTIADLATASPNNTVNNVSMAPTGGTTNVSVSIVPKGTGAFCLQVPDGTSAGGNARGANSIDFQMVRSTAAQVASSDYAFVVGSNNQLSTAAYQACVGASNQLLNGNYQYVFGSSNVLSSAGNVLVVGAGNTASGTYGLAIGDRNSLTSSYGSVLGYFASSYLNTMRAVAQDGYAVVGDTQLIEVTNKAKTTSATPVSWSVAIPSGKMWVVTITAGGIKSDGSNTAGYIRKVTAKNIAGTVTVVSSTTIGTDNEDDAATDFAVTASGANMLLTVTGIAAETWRWHFAIYGVDIKYGT